MRGNDNTAEAHLAELLPPPPTKRASDRQARQHAAATVLPGAAPPALAREQGWALRRGRQGKPPPPQPLLSPEEAARKKQEKREKQLLARRRARLLKAGVRVVDRPWSALSPSQREARLDAAPAWHWRYIFQDEILRHSDKRVRKRAERSTQAEYLLMVRALKMGIDLGRLSVDKLANTKLEDWAAQFLQASDAELLPQHGSKTVSNNAGAATILGTGEPEKERRVEMRGRERPQAVPRAGLFAALDRVIDQQKIEAAKADQPQSGAREESRGHSGPQEQAKQTTGGAEQGPTDGQKQAQDERAARLADFPPGP